MKFFAKNLISFAKNAFLFEKLVNPGNEETFYIKNDFSSEKNGISYKK